jgi:hypothetical protein
MPLIAVVDDEEVSRLKGPILALVALLAPRPHSGQQIAIAGDDDSLLVNNELYQPIEFWQLSSFSPSQTFGTPLPSTSFTKYVRRGNKRHCHRDQAGSGIRTPRRDAIHGLPDADVRFGTQAEYRRIVIGDRHLA